MAVCSSERTPLHVYVWLLARSASLVTTTAVELFYYETVRKGAVVCAALCPELRTL